MTSSTVELYYIFGAAALGMIFLAVTWIVQLGLVRGLLAALFRLGWLLPIFAAFFPRQETEELPRSMRVKPVHVLLDDSQSIEGDSDAKAKTEKLMADLEEACARFGCQPKITKLSEEDPLVALGYTPLSRVLDQWIYKLSSEPWLIISDGGDFRPALAWEKNLEGVGRSADSEPNGLILGTGGELASNIWIESHKVPPFSFESKPIFIDVAVRRSVSRQNRMERIQVQVLAQDNALATVNATFEEGDEVANISVTVPPLPRGQHLLTLRALASPDESAVWDNTVHGQVEVMPNTVGVLHLLGSPSWDGRFLRRYLKSEPKYDLISFFILRDPWDSQQVSERELSLIPFPVERLFQEELPNFRVIIIQNFTLFQFLQPQFQHNLVDFVKRGGGLLFIGGPRALQKSDLSSSPLGAILPFETDYNGSAAAAMPQFPLGLDFGQAKPDTDGPFYDPDYQFKIRPKDPTPVQRSLANVFEDWEALFPSLTGIESLKGLHRMDQVRFKSDKVTPLLEAVGKDGKTMPLAVASYPEKGRALWLFTDSLWRLAMNQDPSMPRQVYGQFMQSAMTWLLRQDMRKPLIAKQFRLIEESTGRKSWKVNLIGPAARYFKPDGKWLVKVCGAVVPLASLSVEKKAADEWELSSVMPVELAGGQLCKFQIDGEHPAFGSVSASITEVFPETYRDSEVAAAPQKLEQLAKLTGARYAETEPSAALNDWLEKKTGQYGVALPNRYKMTRNFYWILDEAWIYLLFLCLPLEVLVRRYHHFFGRRPRHSGLAGEPFKATVP